MSEKTGIASLGLALPPLYMTVEELAKLRNVDPDKFRIGLGCKNMALCSEQFGVVDLATEAAKRALSRWKGDKKNISVIAVGTESAPDMSRPLSAFVAEKLELNGAIRSYEVKHACYGGTVAVRQATEWKLSGVAPGKAALVIAADVALYQEGDAGEATQGAGAVAMIIDQPDIAEIGSLSYPWSLPAFDFWRPWNMQFPLVEGELSLKCYKQAARECFNAFMRQENKRVEDVLKEYEFICFHTPFPKMVKKAFYEICKENGWDDEKIESYYRQKIDPTMDWNRLSGNAYTASLWIAVAKSLCGMAEGGKLIAFSYGSGCGAELLTLRAGPLAAAGAWAQDIQHDVANRKEVTAREYEALRAYFADVHKSKCK